MYYKIKISWDFMGCGSTWIEEYVKAESREEAEKSVPKIINDYKADANGIVEIQEATIDEMIESEKRYFLRTISTRYMHRKYDTTTMNVRQFATLQRELEKDKEKIYEMLKDEGKYARICELVKKKIDKSKVTISEFEQIVLELYNAKTNEECE